MITPMIAQLIPTATADRAPSTVACTMTAHVMRVSFLSHEAPMVAKIATTAANKGV
ncbi:hypothetical protein SDC9_97215 [bioreactor metagenome]|uniref:Uncharacterized protein n=1 Tax=bioreactor metagenome TaxID=1076179 RepID=A0A645ALF2_9ZZZZ